MMASSGSSVVSASAPDAVPSGPQPTPLGEEMLENPDSLNVCLEAAGDMVGFKIDHAARRLDLSTLKMEASPQR